MKILCIGCLHGKFPSKAYAVAKKEDIRLILCPGDLADGGYMRNLEFKYWHKLHEGLSLENLVGRKKLRQAAEHSLKSQLLILHGDADEIVPLQQGRRLYEEAPEPKVFYTIPGAHHNDTYLVGGSEYWRAWREFLGKLPGA